MRPEILFPIFKPATSIKGVGPRIGALIEKLAGPYLVHLLWHLPTDIIDRRHAPTIAAAMPGTVATITVRVTSHATPPNKRMPYRVFCADDTGTMVLLFFHSHEDYLRKNLPEGKTVIISGAIESFNNDVQMVHPDHIVPLAEAEQIPQVEPVYRLTTGLTQKSITRGIDGALESLPELPEWLDQNLIDQHHWPDWSAAVRDVHAPSELSDLISDSPARTRLAYDELLANQLTLALVRRQVRRIKGRALAGDGGLRAGVRKKLPFELTAGQENVCREIDVDMASAKRMLRLLQGDVGSGKTVVALLAMLNAVENGAQAILMAPTDTLARQHLATIAPLAEAAGVTLVVLTAREKGKARTTVIEALASGAAAIAVGTHALFQDDVVYKDLAIAVIDEQHRFGVHQRLTLTGKGSAVDVLVITATPIPRSLMLTAYGDMDISRLIDKPAGRIPVETRVMPVDRLDDVATAVGRALNAGNKIFWVCPFIEESETVDAAAAEERFAHLQQAFGNRVGLVHGRMKGPDKDRVMKAFTGGDVGVLVATTVIEVGVDVPQATVMVIEHAERFGLAQLHQLRGRVGRSEQPSTCLLLYGRPLTKMALARLNIMRDTDDGFLIAEEDLRLRGAGEVLGTKQSGLPEFHLTNLEVHSDLLAIARDDAALILNKDPDLDSSRGEALRTLLYLFERDTAVGNLRSG